MEVAAAVKLWNRSLQYNFRYLNFIGDGDSYAYLAVKASNGGEGPYGEKKVTKEYCVNHYSKRLGTALREVVKQPVTNVGGGRRVRTLGGRHRVTGDVIKKLSSYFTKAVRDSINTSPQEMSDRCMSSFYHCSASDANPTHDLCPKRADSWCFYQNALANGREPEPHAKKMQVYFHLEPHELQLVKNVYERLTSDENMIKCLRGKTQNPNESLHAIIWIHCPKHLKTSNVRFEFAAAVAVSHYK